MFSGHDRPGHGGAVHLGVEGPDGKAQTPHVVVPFVVHLGKALLGLEGGRARAFGPRSTTQVFDDLVLRGGWTRATVRGPLASKVNDAPVDGRHQKAGVLRDFSWGITEAQQQPGCGTQEQHAEKRTKPKQRVNKGRNQQHDAA